jgi:hypothetical protein
MSRSLTQTITRGHKHTFRVTESAEQFNDIDRVTLETLRQGKLAKIKLLTFPHKHLLKTEADFAAIADLAPDSVFVFNFDPIKPVHQLRKLRVRGYRHHRKSSEPRKCHENVLELSDATESVFESCLLRHFIAPSARQQRTTDAHFSNFEGKFITDSNLDFCNSNIRAVLFYLGLSRSENSLLAFGGYPETLLRAKMAQLTSKDLLFNGYLSFLQAFGKSEADSFYMLQMFEMDPHDLLKLRFNMNTFSLKAKYLYEYSKAIAEIFEQDIVIVVDPFIKYYVNSWARHDDRETGGFNTSSSKAKASEPKTQHLLASSLRNLFSETWVEKIQSQGFISAPHLDANFPIHEHSNLMAKINNEFARSTFDELNSLRSFDDFDDSQVSELIFKMALFDVINETTLYESEFISSQFYYINKNVKAFTRVQFEELRKKFFVSYQGIKIISDRFLLAHKKERSDDGGMGEFYRRNFDLEDIKFTGIFDLDSA